jgi:hypothetical protein
MGVFVVGACAPLSRQEDVHRALMNLAGSLTPVERTGLDVALERAQELTDAARGWRYVLAPSDVDARVAVARKAALIGLRSAKGFDTSAAALMASADVLAMDALGVQAGTGYDAAAVVEVLSKASALDKTFAARSWLLGRALLDTGNPAGALQVLEARAAELARPDARLLFTIGEARQALGRKAEAREAWQRARVTLAADRRLNPPGSGPLAADAQRRQEELAKLLDERL